METEAWVSERNPDVTEQHKAMLCVYFPNIGKQDICHCQ